MVTHSFKKPVEILIPHLLGGRGVSLFIEFNSFKKDKNGTEGKKGGGRAKIFKTHLKMLIGDTTENTLLLTKRPAS